MSDSTLSSQPVGGRYSISEVIGKGGMGMVYRGVDTTTQQPVAIKMLKSDTLTSDHNVLDRFKREAEALRQLDHPNIVKVLDTIDEGDLHYIIMEYVGGGTLADLLKKEGALPPKRAMEIALELADALSRAHHVKIIHRDIKPSNVLLAEDGSSRLTDFGVARIETQERVTQPGITVGTLDYLSPEALGKAAVDARTDIWSFGVMLFEMLSGQRPFDAEDSKKVLANIMIGDLPDLKALKPDLPDVLITLIKRMLDKNTSTRIASARQVGAEIEAILRGDSAATDDRFTLYTPPPSELRLPDEDTFVGAADPTQSKKPAARPRKFMPLMLIASVVVLVVLTSIGFVASAFNGNHDKSAESPTQPSALVDNIATDEPTAEASSLEPESTFESDVTMQVLDDGRRQFTVGKLGMIVPGNWLDVSDTSLTMIESLSDQNQNFAEFYSLIFDEDWPILMAGQITAFTGVIVRRETLPDALNMALLESRQDLVFETIDTTISDVGVVTTSAGDMLHMRVVLPENIIGFRVFDVYHLLDDRLLYWIIFFAPEANFDATVPLFQQVLDSMTFEQTE